MSPQSSLTRIVSHSSDHACTHQSKSDLKCREYPLSLLPSHCPEMKSPIRYGLEATGFAVTFCSAVLMLLNMSILPLTVSFISVRNCCVTSASSCLNCCCNVTISAALTMAVHTSAAAGAAADADFRRLSSASTRDVAERRSASMSNATLFCGNLQPTRMRWCICDKCCRPPNLPTQLISTLHHVISQRIFCRSVDPTSAFTASVSLVFFFWDNVRCPLSRSSATWKRDDVTQRIAA